MSEREKKAYLGIDLGGSNIYSVAFDETWLPLVEEKIDTEAKAGYEAVVQRIEGQVERVEQQLASQGYVLSAIGLGVPGVTRGTIVSFAPNLDWKNVNPLADSGLGQRSAILCNDVNAGLVGELTRIDPIPAVVAAYFCGTGVGGAVAVNGRLITGLSGGAGEVGHMVVRANGKRVGEGVRGSLESYIGKWALNRKIQKAFKDKKKTLLRELIRYDLDKTPIKSSSLKKAYERGDQYTRRLMDYYVKYLAIGMSQTVNLLSPHLIILGGGIMEAMGAQLLPLIRKKLKRYSVNEIPELRLAALGDLAGPLGAAALARGTTGGEAKGAQPEREKP